MNKEKIEKAKCHLEWLLDNGILASEDEPHIENILKYIQHLEQKSEKLDKVTDKLKEDKNKKIPLAEDMDWVICRKQYAREILNIIEGEKK